jgi:Carboxypeptidase regulatory-like domain
MVTDILNWGRAARFLFCVLALSFLAHAQSTFGTVLGTVKDPSGSVIPTAKVELVNTGTNAVRDTETNSNGGYQFVNIDVGSYRLSIEAAGFQKTEFQSFELSSRDTKHIDLEMKVATQATVVTVEAIAVVQTDASNIAETKGSLELTDLPVAITTRSQGSTSAFSTLTSQPGVQTDGTNIEVAGAMPSQLSLTIDGISSVGPGSLGALAELFPSFNAIEEIKISETLNPAEYGGVADITTVSKSGTNNYHGGLFENVQNTDFNAADFFSNQVTPVKMNDFGLYVGGPVIFPHLYDGRNKTFFFGSYEVLRLPKSQTALLSVPTEAMRNGDLSAYPDPLNGFPGNIIPKSELSPFSQKLLNEFYPLPNYGPPGAIANNYLVEYQTPINSAQGDVRVDQMFGPKHLVYARYTYKNRRVVLAPEDGDGNPGSPAPGGTSRPEIYNALAAAYNWVISPSVVNELRGGFSIIRRGYSSGITAQQSAQELGLSDLPGPPPPGYATPSIILNGFTGTYPYNTIDINPREATYQILDSLTWTKQKHTFKFGGDFRYLSSLFTNVFSDYRMGVYTFDGSSAAVNALLNPNGNPGSGVPLAGFLLGYPDNTTIATVVNPTTDAYSKHYAVYAQDDWKISQSLTINYGLRWEYHPGFQDKDNDVVNWYPNYTSTVNGQVLHGAVILPNQAAFANINPQFTESLEDTPEILASKVGVPAALRDSSKLDFAPRIGFAYRIGGNNKTVLRGGYGRFIEALMSGSAINGWSVGSSDVAFFSNDNLVNGKPQYSLPYSYPSNIAQPGSYFFDLASEINFKDPIVEEWNLTLERDLGQGIGVRASYSGNHSYNVPTLINYNQVHPNTLGINDPTIQAQIPFPQLQYFQAASNEGFGNYQAGTISVHKHTSSIQFEASYTYTRDLSNIIGAASSPAQGFASEFGNELSDPYHPGLDYGNTPFDRRHRFLASVYYELPFGKGKKFLNSVNRATDAVLGGWVLSGIAVFQSGPFMTVSTSNDPSGTGYNQLFSSGGRADTVPGVSPYAGQSINQWINPAAFSDPPDNIGRFGDSLSGAVVGPGTKVVSISLLKRVALTESLRAEFGAQVANVANHPNFAPPNNLTISIPAGFGQLTSLQQAEGAGPRQIQLTARLTF